MRQNMVILGAVVGCAGALITWLMPHFFVQSWFGALAGVVIAMFLGGTATWLTSYVTQQDLAESLMLLKNPAAPIPSTNNPELDELFGEVRQTVERWYRIRDDVETAERLLQWSRYNDGVTTTIAANSPVMALFQEVRNHVMYLADDSLALAATSDRIAAGVSKQETPLNDTTDNLVELYEKTEQITMNSDSASESTKRVFDAARHGLEQVNEMVKGMEQIQMHVEGNARQMERLGASSIEISDITGMIDLISKQTEHLASNSEIAAARAGGEHGREFSQVASEIRKLAERTANASGDISERVQAIQSHTRESIKAFDKEKAEVQREVQRVKETKDALVKISDISEKSAKMVVDILSSAQDQVDATKKVIRLVQEVDQVRKDAKKESAETHAFISRISQRCEQLRRLCELTQQNRTLPPLGGGPGHGKNVGVNDDLEDQIGDARSPSGKPSKSKPPGGGSGGHEHGVPPQPQRSGSSIQEELLKKLSRS